MRRSLLKPFDAWSEVFIADPLTTHIAVQLAKIPGIHPLHITAISQFLKFLGAAFYFIYPDPFTVIPPILFFFGILFDAMDGKIARITGKDIELHGTLDFTTDQITIVVFYLSMLFAFESQSELIPWMYVWMLMLFVLISLTSSLHRLQASLGGVNVDDRDELREKYDEIFSSTIQNNFLKKILQIYSKMIEKAAKYRVFPRPTTPDSEFLFFVIFPILVALNSPFAIYVLIISVIFFIPDILHIGALVMILTKRLGNLNKDKS
jgi:phosphatidylglycerophosphate synthase